MRVLLACLPLAVAGCASLPADTPAEYDASPLGNGERISQVTDPSAATYTPNQNVNLTSVVTVWQDTFDETRSRRRSSRGTCASSRGTSSTSRDRTRR
jgi:hypothetical protein